MNTLKLHKQKIIAFLIFYIATVIYIRHFLVDHYQPDSLMPLLALMFQTWYYVIIFSIFFPIILLAGFKEPQPHEVIRYGSFDKFFYHKIKCDFIQSVFTVAGIYLLLIIVIKTGFFYAPDNPLPLPFYQNGDLPYVPLNILCALIFTFLFSIGFRYICYMHGTGVCVLLIIGNIILANLGLRTPLGAWFPYIFPNNYFSFHDNLMVSSITLALCMMLFEVFLIFWIIFLAPKRKSVKKELTPGFILRRFGKNKTLLCILMMVFLGFFKIFIDHTVYGVTELHLLLFSDYAFDSISPLHWIFHILFSMTGIWFTAAFVEDLHSQFQDLDRIRFPSKKAYALSIFLHMALFLLLLLVIYTLVTTLGFVYFGSVSVSFDPLSFFIAFVLRYLEWINRLCILLLAVLFMKEFLAAIAVCVLTGATVYNFKVNILNSSAVFYNSLNDLLIWIICTMVLLLSLYTAYKLKKRI